MAKKEKAKKPEAPEADAPAGEGGEGAPAKKKMAGKTLVLFIILPAILVLGGGGAAGIGCGTTACGGTICGGAAGRLPADNLACSARATTSSGGVDATGIIARSTTRSSRISQGQIFSVTKSSGKISYQGTGNG